MKIQNKNILLVSNEPWGDVWYSKHKYAVELSKQNKVFFLDPVSKWKVIDLFSFFFDIRKVSEKLYVIKYTNKLPVVNSFFYNLNNLLVCRLLKSRLKKNNIQNIIFWTFDPARLHTPKKLGAEISFFHAVDDYQFRFFEEKALCKNVNYIFCISKSFMQKYALFKKPVFYVPHALMKAEFSIDKESSITISFKNYGLYIGVLDERVDYTLLKKIIENFPTLTFLFIGPLRFHQNNLIAHELFFEKKYKNLKYLDTIPFQNLKYYIDQSAFCLAVMNEKYPGNLTGHQKIRQYLALGKPVFCNIFTDFTEISELMYMYANPLELLDKLKTFVEKGENITLKEKRIQYALGFSFENIFNNIDEYIQTNC